MAKKKTTKGQKNAPLKDYARYSGVAFKMGIIIFIGVYGGLKLDAFFAFEKPIFVLIGSISSVALAIYAIIKDFLNP